METSFKYSAHSQQEKSIIVEPKHKIMTEHPINANSLITGSVTPKFVKLVKPQTSSTSVVTPTTGLTQCFTIVPLMNKSNPSRIQSHESPVTVPMTSSMQQTASSIIDSQSDTRDEELDDEKENDSVFNNDGHFIWNHKTIMLFFSEYDEHEKKLQKKKYQSKEAMFQALAESFQKKGYVNATKNHMKNKFKLLKKKWDKHIKRTIGKNSSGKGTKPLSYEDEMIRMFGKSHSGVPPFVAGRNEIVSQEEILQMVRQNLPEHENEKQQEQPSTSHSLLMSPVTLESYPLSSRSNSPATDNTNVSTLPTNSSRSSIAGSSCSSLINARAKVRDGKLALTLQSVKESICAMLQKESDDKQETRIKFLTELQKCNDLQKERNSILQKQLMILEKMANKVNPTEKELSSDED